jgi:hypothetical protein
MSLHSRKNDIIAAENPAQKRKKGKPATRTAVAGLPGEYGTENYGGA